MTSNHIYDSLLKILMKRLLAAILTANLLIFGFISASPGASATKPLAPAQETQDIRVAIFKDIPTATIQGNGLQIFTSSRLNQASKPLQSIVIVPTPKGLKVNNKMIQADKLAISSANHLLTVNGTKHRGTLLISQSNTTALLVVNNLPIEDYLQGLIFSEIAPSWPKEAIKAQAVTARTYALYKRAELKNKNSPQLYDVESTVSDQVYNGAQEDPRVLTAIRETTGEVVTKDRRLVKTYYHSTCAGQTEVSRNVWGDENGIPAIKDSYCKRSNHKDWRYSVSRKTLAAMLNSTGHPAKKVLDIRANYLPDNPRTQSLSITTNTETFDLPVNKFRELLGFKNLKSAWFTIKSHRKEFVFNGHGFGHGVGMCQWGARGMAEAGRSHQEILTTFYPGTIIEKIY